MSDIEGANNPPTTAEDPVAIVREQAQNPNLWRRDGGLLEEGGVPVTLFERELQAALERLHHAVLLIDGRDDA